MKKTTWYSLLVAIVAIIGIGLGVYSLNSNTPEEIQVVTLDAQKGIYKMMNVAANYEFEINGNLENQYELKDMSGNTVPSRIVQRNDRYYIVAENSYRKNVFYYLKIIDDNVQLQDERIKDARNVTFYTTGSGEAEATLQSDVKRVAIIRKEEERLILSDEVNAGDIIEVDPGNGLLEYYEVTTVNIQDGQYITTVSVPDYTKVYKAIHIFKDEVVDTKNVKFNRDVIIEQLKTAGILDLLPDVYADDNTSIDVKISQDEEGVSYFTVVLEGDVTLEYSIGFKLQYQTAIQYDEQLKGGGYGVELMVVEKPKLRIDYKTSGSKTLDETELLSGIQEKLRLSNIPMYIILAPGIVAEFDLTPVFEYKGEAFLEVEGENRWVLKAGIFDAGVYSNISYDNYLGLTIEGGLRTDLGIQFVAGIKLANITKVVELDTYIGAYNDIKGKASIAVGNGNITDKTGYFQFVLGYKTTGEIDVDVIFVKKTYSLWESDNNELLNISYGVQAFQKIESLDKYHHRKGEVTLDDLKLVYKNQITGEVVKYTLFDEEIENPAIYVDDSKIEIGNKTMKTLATAGEHSLRIDWEFKGEKMSQSKKFEVVEKPLQEYYAPVFNDFNVIIDTANQENQSKKSIVERYGDLKTNLHSWLFENLVEGKAPQLRYSFYDVNNDGISEMLISMKVEEGGIMYYFPSDTKNKNRVLLAVYTLNNDRPIVVGQTWVPGQGGSREMVRAYKNVGVVNIHVHSILGSRAELYSLSADSVKKVAEVEFKWKDLDVTKLGLDPIDELDLSTLNWESFR